MNIKKLILTPFLFIFLLKSVKAHCPLCTVGAAVAAGGAKWLGVDTFVVGIFIGAFALSMGWWFSRLIKKKYIPWQNMLIILVIFLLTIIPLLPLLGEIYAWNLFITGGYGTLLNRTYLIDTFLVGSIIGGIVVSLTPWISSKITKKRGKIIPYQGVALTFVLLLIIGVLLQFLF